MWSVEFLYLIFSLIKAHKIDLVNLLLTIFVNFLTSMDFHLTKNKIFSDTSSFIKSVSRKMANVFRMDLSSYDKSTSSPLPISGLVRSTDTDANKRAKLNSNTKQTNLKQTSFWGWTKKDTTSSSSKSSSGEKPSSTCTSPGNNMVTTAAVSTSTSILEDAFDTMDKSFDPRNIDDPDNLVESQTQVLLGEEIEDGYTQDSTQENKWEDPKVLDKKPAANKKSKKSYHNLKEDDEVSKANDEVEFVSVLYPIKTEESLVERPIGEGQDYCDWCQNFGDNYHELAFGEFLVQEVVTWLEDKDKDKDNQKDVTHAHVSHEMKWNYNRHLNYLCWGTKHKYNNNCWHEMSVCLLKHSVQQAVDMIDNLQLLAELKSRREDRAAKRYTKYNPVDKQE